MVLEMTPWGAYRIKVRGQWIYTGAQTLAEAVEYGFYLLTGKVSVRKLSVKCLCDHEQASI